MNIIRRLLSYISIMRHSKKIYDIVDRATWGYDSGLYFSHKMKHIVYRRRYREYSRVIRIVDDNNYINIKIYTSNNSYLYPNILVYLYENTEDQCIVELSKKIDTMLRRMYGDYVHYRHDCNNKNRVNSIYEEYKNMNTNGLVYDVKLHIDKVEET